MEYTDDYELILICGDGLEHVWEQGNCNSKMMREITIQYLLNDLSECEGVRTLASSSFAHAERNTESRRVRKVKEYINQNYNKDIKLASWQTWWE